MRLYHSDITKPLYFCPSEQFKLNIQLSYGICNVNFLIYKSSQFHHDIRFSLRSKIRPTPPIQSQIQATCMRPPFNVTLQAPRGEPGAHGRRLDQTKGCLVDIMVSDVILNRPVEGKSAYCALLSPSETSARYSPANAPRHAGVPALNTWCEGI